MARSFINQKLIAELAGVSQTTVSLVLAGKLINSNVTRQKVVDAASSIGYRPNLLIQGIQTGKTRVIGVMVPPFDFYWTAVLFGIHDGLASADHVSSNIWANYHGTMSQQIPNVEIDALQQIHRLVDRRVDGVILWPPLASLFEEKIKAFSSRNLPIVTIDHCLPDTFRADSVGTDEETAGHLVANHLLDLGHRVIGYLAGPSEMSWAQRRGAAFQSVVQQHSGTTCIPIEVDVRQVDQGIVEARQLLDRPGRPTAIYAATDSWARSVYRAADERGLSIPRDLAVVGFADQDFSPFMSPPLTTVRQSAYEVGQQAAKLVMARSQADNNLGEIIKISLPASLIVRASTASPNENAVG